MKYFSLTFIFFLSSCSGTVANFYLELNETDDLYRVTVYDWYEKETTGPAFGVYRPPIYAYQYQSEYYIIYPLLVEEGKALFGPPGIPIIPADLGMEGEDPEYFFRIRHYKEEGVPQTPPTRISLNANGDRVESCELNIISTTVAGTLSTCRRTYTPEENEFVELVLTLADGHEKKFTLKMEEYSMYSPLLSFNSPPPKPEIEITEKQAGN
jgi:hypothetical protein